MMSLPPAALYEMLIDAVGTPSLGEVLLGATAPLGIAEVFGFRVEGDAAPVLLASSGRRGSSLARASLYVDGLHMLDPLLPQLREAGAAAEVVAVSMAARDIVNPAYRRDCFDRPGLAEKVAFGRRCGERSYVLSFYRGTDHGPVNLGELSTVARFALPVLRRHSDLLDDEIGLSLVQRIERRLQRSFPRLSTREREVCARTLLGMTAEATALALDIGQTSVLTYRRRAYERYGVSSVGQFIEPLLH